MFGLQWIEVGANDDRKVSFTIVLLESVPLLGSCSKVELVPSNDVSKICSLVSDVVAKSAETTATSQIWQVSASNKSRSVQSTVFALSLIHI